MNVHKIDWSAVPWTPVRPGVERKAFSGEGATVALHRLMPEHEPRPHSHSYEQIVYILAGRMRFHVNGESHLLGPGEAKATDRFPPTASRTGGIEFGLAEGSKAVITFCKIKVLRPKE